jgi:hypothetical protein
MRPRTGASEPGAGANTRAQSSAWRLRRSSFVRSSSSTDLGDFGVSFRPGLGVARLPGLGVDWARLVRAPAESMTRREIHEA